MAAKFGTRWPLGLSPKPFSIGLRRLPDRSLMAGQLQCSRYSSSAAPPRLPLRPGRLRRFLRVSAFGLFFTSVGFLIATAPAVASIVSLMSAPSDAESAAMYRASDEVAKEIDDHITNHPIAVALRANPTWTESRPHLRFPEAYKKHSLTAGTLLGPGRVPVPPLVFTDDRHLVCLSYLGSDLCGHAGIVHGGMIATMMDEGMGRCAFTALPNHVGVTAYLHVNYRNPTPAGSYVVLRAETTKVEGRKAFVKATLELLGDGEQPGKILMDGDGLFVEPKYAKMLPKIFDVR